MFFRKLLVADIFQSFSTYFVSLSKKDTNSLKQMLPDRSCRYEGLPCETRLYIEEPAVMLRRMKARMRVGRDKVSSFRWQHETINKKKQGVT